MSGTLPGSLFEHYLGISRLLAGQLDFNSIIQAVATEISHIIPHDHLDVCIKLVDGKYHVAYESGLESDWSRQPPALLSGSPIRSLLSGEVDHLLSGDALHDPRFHFDGAFSSPIIALSLHSRLHVPLRVQGDIIGALSCSRHARDAYRPEDVFNARAVADLLAPYFFAIRSAEQARRSAIEEAAANAREEGLRAGALELTDALEAERQRIGMDLHDQTLADLTRLVRRAAPLVRMGTVNGEMLEPLVRGLHDCMHDLRQIIEEARPSILQLFGLVQAIETCLDRAVRDSGADIECDIVDDSDGMIDTLDQGVATSLFRIVQEAINNAIRHARASRIVVTLRRRDGWLVVDIADDGVGVDMARLSGGRGVGNMKTRAQLISARFTAGRNRNGPGTCISVAVRPGGADNGMEEL